jgi:hypothetical protein
MNTCIYANIKLFCICITNAVNGAWHASYQIPTYTSYMIIIKSHFTLYTLCSWDYVTPQCREKKLFSWSINYLLLWKPDGHCHVNKSLPLYHKLSHINPVYTITSYFCNIHFNIILLSVISSSSCSHSLRFSSLPCLLHVHQFHPPWWNHQKTIKFMKNLIK